MYVHRKFPVCFESSLAAPEDSRLVQIVGVGYCDQKGEGRGSFAGQCSWITNQYRLFFDIIACTQLETSLDSFLTEVCVGFVRMELVLICFFKQHVARLNEVVAALHAITTSKLDDLLVYHRNYYERLGQDFVNSKKVSLAENTDST